jgi:hypothetical protein
MSPVLIKQPTPDRSAHRKWRREKQQHTPEHAPSNGLVSMWQYRLAHGAALRGDWKGEDTEHPEYQQRENHDGNSATHIPIVSGVAWAVNFGWPVN